MLESNITNFLLLPKLKFVHFEQIKSSKLIYHCASDSHFAICPKCQTKTDWIHDKRFVTIQDMGGRSKIIFQMLKLLSISFM